LVAVPALGFVYYFKKYNKITNKGIAATLIISAIIIVAVLEGIIPGLPSLAGKFEIYFVNDLGMPFGSGILFFVLAIIGALVYRIIYSIKSQKNLLSSCLISVTFILICYAAYSAVLVRSNFDPTRD